MSQLRLCVAVGLIMASATAGVAANTDDSESRYRLRILAKSGDVIDGRTLTTVALPLSMSHNGRVAFTAFFPGHLGIFTRSRVLVESGDVISGLTLTGIGSFATNDSGTLAFLGQSGGFLGPTGAFTRSRLIAGTGDTIDGKTLTEVGAVTMNERGRIVFMGSFPGGTGIFTPNRLLVKTGDVIGNKTLIAILGRGPSIDDRGIITFAASFSGGSGLFTQSRLRVQSGDVIDGETVVEIGLWGTSENGRLAFFGFLPGGGGGIFTPSRLLVKVGDVIGGRTLTSIDDPAINDFGTVAFVGCIDPLAQCFSGGRRGLFTQSKLVVETGDVIEGKTVTDFAAPAINNSGKIAFHATFADGTSAIVVARPNCHEEEGDEDEQ